MDVQPGKASVQARKKQAALLDVVITLSGRVSMDGK
jgi:hypothetical protein